MMRLLSFAYLPLPVFKGWRASAGAAIIVLLAGCAYYEAKPLSIDKTGVVFEARSLASESLRDSLTQNLGRNLPAWPPAEWDFESLAWVAFFYNPSLEVVRVQWETAKAGVKTASARPNPTLSLTPGYNSSASGGVSPWFPAGTLDFLLEHGGKRELRARVAELGAESARLSVFSAAWQVRSELRRALLDLEAAERRIDSLRAQAETQQRVVALLEQRRSAGAIAANDVSVARVALVRASAAVADAERQIPLARQRVAQALGIPAAAVAGLKFAVMKTNPPLTGEQLAAARRQALQSRADVLAALARFEAAQSALELEVAKQRPDFHLGPGYQWDQGENKWSVALTFELPVFNHNEGPIGEAEARRREAAAQFLAAQARALAEIDAAVAAQQAATGQLDQLGRIRAELERQQTATAARLRAGGADQLEVQNGSLELTAATLAARDAEAQAAAAAGQLEDALQVPFPNLAALAAPARPSASTTP